jgi:signal transduction histidine kinase
MSSEGIQVRPLSARSSPIRDPRPFMWSVSLSWGLVVAASVITTPSSVTANLWDLVPWIAVATVVNLLPLPTRFSAHLVVDLPVEIAAALALQPIQAGLVGFISAVDTREFRQQITPTKAIFNKSNLALSYFLTSVLAHSLAERPAESPWILGIGALVLAGAFIENIVLVATVIWLERGARFRDVVRSLPLGTWPDFVWAFVSWAVLGSMLAALYGRTHPLAIVAFLGPIVLTRQMLLRSQAYIDTSLAYTSKERALREIATRIREERSDERRLIAADLHDQVLQPLFNVSLMANVLKVDLARGQLLELDQDLPELLTAADIASTTLRELIGDLRRSSLGRGGLSPAISRFVQSVASRSPISVHCAIGPAAVDPDAELALYQIAREAIWNAFTHSKARNIWIELVQQEGIVQLSVRDDGVGFDPAQQLSDHYGLSIMQERANGIQAHLAIDSSPGGGCVVAVVAPSTPNPVPQ